MRSARRLSWIVISLQASSTRFLSVTSELYDAHKKIQAARRFYNGGVRDLNTKIEQFPTNIVASVFKFAKREFFEVEDMATIEKPVEVQF